MNAQPINPITLTIPMAIIMSTMLSRPQPMRLQGKSVQKSTRKVKIKRVIHHRLDLLLMLKTMSQDLLTPPTRLQTIKCVSMN